MARNFNFRNSFFERKYVISIWPIGKENFDQETCVSMEEHLEGQMARVIKATKIIDKKRN